MTYWEEVHSEEINGFDITLSITPEDYAPDWDFESEEEKQNLLDRIDSGDVLWFCARVTASKCDIELSSDYLGGCCYDDIKQFINDEDYKDMVLNVIKQANAKILELTNKG